MKMEIMLHEWKVKLKDKRVMDKEEKGTLGLTQFPSREIWILDTLQADELKQVATHETVHSLLYEFGCSDLGNYNDEFVCDFISNNMDMIKNLADKFIDFLYESR